jgi:hypothetical protein
MVRVICGGDEMAILKMVFPYFMFGRVQLEVKYVAI